MTEPIAVESLSELVKREPEIVARIARHPKGGALFVAHPLRCLRQVGVRLAPRVRQALIAENPSLAHRSAAAYEAIERSTGPGDAIRIRGLFRRSR